MPAIDDQVGHAVLVPKAQERGGGGGEVGVDDGGGAGAHAVGVGLVEGGVGFERDQSAAAGEVRDVLEGAAGPAGEHRIRRERLEEIHHRERRADIVPQARVGGHADAHGQEKSGESDCEQHHAQRAARVAGQEALRERDDSGGQRQRDVDRDRVERVALREIKVRQHQIGQHVPDDGGESQGEQSPSRR
ncbi:MAG TPA: hypothetical protein VGR35_12345 [Tepidisphaeraceae bacterium]|nr:hypothetical protein [Tepidisphaeraceae bacterium]